MKRLVMIAISFASLFSAIMCNRAPADTTTLSESTTASTVTTTSTVTTASTVSSTYSGSGTSSGNMNSSTSPTTGDTVTSSTSPTTDTVTTTLWTEGTDTNPTQTTVSTSPVTTTTLWTEGTDTTSTQTTQDTSTGTVTTQTVTTTTTTTTTTHTTYGPTVTTTPTTLGPTVTTEATTTDSTTTGTWTTVQTTIPTGTTTVTTTGTTTATTTETTIPTTTTSTTTMTTTSTTTTATSATTEDLPDTIAEILSQAPTGTVSVTGVVYYIIATPELPSYYVYDGTGTILVFNDSHSVTVGQGIYLEASFDGQSPAPQLVGVTVFEDSEVFTTLPEFAPATIADILSHPSTDRAFHGATLHLAMMVDLVDTPFGMQVNLVDSTSPTGFIVVNPKSFAAQGFNPYMMLDGQSVTVDAVVHAFEPGQSVWHVLTISDPVVPPPFTPGEGGALDVPEPTAPIAGQFSGLYLYEVERDLWAWNGNTPLTDWVANMTFPTAGSLGGTGYVLQYFDSGDSTWKPLEYGGLSQPFDATWDNLSLDLDTAYTMRLLLQGGPLDGHVSNTIDYAPSLVESEFTGWSYSDGWMGGTGIPAPFVGYEIYDVSVSASNWSSGTSEDVSEWVTIRWYRVDPVTFGMTLIPDATGSSYITTAADAGFLIAFRAEGDGVHVGGYFQRVLYPPVALMNQAYVTDATAEGFTIHFYHTVDGLNPEDFLVYDQDGLVVPIASVVALDGAQYAVTFADSTITSSYGISYTEGSWTAAFPMGFGGMHEYSQFFQVQLSQ